MAGNVASQIGAITAMNLRNVASASTSSIVALVGIAGVVTVLIGVLSIARRLSRGARPVGCGRRRDRPAQRRHR